MKDPFKYVAVGASDANGVGAVPQSNGYVFLIEAALRAEGYNVELTNLGINGATTDRILADELPLALASSADLITIFVGGNDILKNRSSDEFAKDLHLLMSGLSTVTGSRRVIANLPDFTQLPAFANTPYKALVGARVGAYNAHIKREALANDAVLVDLSLELLEATLINRADGFHPSDAGHAALADRYLKMIRPIL